jgi:hypothetical protein
LICIFKNSTGNADKQNFYEKKARFQKESRLSCFKKRFEISGLSLKATNEIAPANPDDPPERESVPEGDAHD